MQPDNLQDQKNYMVQFHLRKRGIDDESVIRAFEEVPRENFIPDYLRQHAYEDRPLPIGAEQTISQPYIVAYMTQLLDITKEDTVLEIGTGSGYQTAILAKLAKAVYTVERHQELADAAKKRLDALGLTNIYYTVGDGTLGWPEHAPYDKIVVTASAPKIPSPLTEQLAMHGRLVMPVGDFGYQQLVVAVKTERGLTTTNAGSCVFVKLIGKEGWPEED